MAVYVDRFPEREINEAVQVSLANLLCSTILLHAFGAYRRSCDIIIGKDRLQELNFFKFFQ
jgi:hypothetical protein